ncbi:GntR family transcriptional regulator [Corynebacterium pyruviciproducens]|mgnify:CR=1 FL=1|uniref:GntR family transcriptional regulator n=1 Tax=Corynebacterium pyruviciproducens TaxID=598660 RepID=UPI0023F34A92|nr:GntR family transcriptional regulator [Corynebacterium pyruviciproducens]
MNLPKYMLVKRAIAQMCAERENGDRLPSESQIGKALDVSRITVRRAMDDLQEDGIIRRVQGLGTFVAPVSTENEPVTEMMAPLGFFAQMNQRGHRVDSKVLHCDQVSADARIASELGIKLDSKVHRLSRLRSLDGSLHHITTAWWPAFLPGISEETDMSHDSLYSTLRSLGIPIGSEQVTVGMRHPSGDEATLLDISEDQTCLSSYSRVFSLQGKQLLFSSTLRKNFDSTMTFVVNPTTSVESERNLDLG